MNGVVMLWFYCNIDLKLILGTGAINGTKILTL